VAVSPCTGSRVGGRDWRGGESEGREESGEKEEGRRSGGGKAGQETRSESSSWPPEQLREEEESARVGASSLVSYSL